ncbi:MAG: TRAP transporter small permease [Rhizobiales bacterium]|nr:TRAP transporter small permease [Hyphomicrobiales bacterium]
MNFRSFIFKQTAVVLPGIAKLMALMSGLIFLLLSFYITIDTMGRSFGWFYSGLTEGISAYALAIAGSWGFAYALYTRGHVRIDLLLPMFPKKIQKLLDVLAIGLAGYFTCLLAYHTYELAARSLRLNIKSISTFQAPLFLPQMLLAFGLFMTTLIAFQMTISGLRALRHPPKVAVDDANNSENESKS